MASNSRRPRRHKIEHFIPNWGGDRWRAPGWDEDDPGPDGYEPDEEDPDDD